MTIALRGYTQGAYSATGQHTVAWPSGTAVDDIAILFCGAGSDKKPVTKAPYGWTCAATTSDGMSAWWRRVTTADLSAPIAVTARIQLLQVFSGASAAIGAVGRGESLGVTYAGGALVLCGWKFTPDTLTESAKIHATDVVNASYVYKGDARKVNTWLSVMSSPGTAYIDTNARTFLGLELFPHRAPYPPTRLSPQEDVFLNYGEDIYFSWKHNSGSNAPQTWASLWASASGEDWQFLRTDGDWQTTEILPFRWTDEFMVAHSTGLTNNKRYQWMIRTGDSSGFVSSGGDTYGHFNLRPRPTVSVSVTGTDMSRTVLWTPTITNGSQVLYRVRICPAADSVPDAPLHDSGLIAGEDSAYVVPSDIGWENGASYKAWVEIGQTGGQETVPTASSSFTVSWTVPDGPATPTVQPGAPTTVSAAGLTVGRKVRLSYTVGGVARVAVQEVTAASMSFDVPLAPYGIPTTYSIEQSGTVSGVEVWSDPVTVTGISYDARSYVVSTDGLSWRRVVIYRASEPEDTEGISVSYGLGSSTPSVLRTPSQGLRGEDVVIVETQAAKDDLLAWLADNPTFDFRRPPERSRTTLVDVPPLRVARVSQRSESRLVNSQVQLRTIPLSWVQQ